MMVKFPFYALGFAIGATVDLVDFGVGVVYRRLRHG